MRGVLILNKCVNSACVFVSFLLRLEFTFQSRYSEIVNKALYSLSSVLVFDAFVYDSFFVLGSTSTGPKY